MSKKLSKPLRKKILTLNIIWLIFSVFAYLSANISPIDFWLAGFLAWSTPVFLVGHLFFLFYWMFFFRLYLILPILGFIFGYNFLNASFSFHFKKNPTPNKKNFKVLSYNVRVFNAYENWKNPEKSDSEYLIDWVAENDADIKCLQEFYHTPNSEVFNTIQKIAFEQSYSFYVTPVEKLQRETGFFGVAILSRFPIVGSGDIPLGTKTHQNGIYIDVKIDRDTVRIFNVHLRSMSIDEKAIFEKEKNQEETKTVFFDLFKRLKNGFIDRANQVEVLKTYFLKSPYPVIICGDFNDLPYSYTYQYLKNDFKNAFENAGTGFGFSYNGLLFFLRIDNQFYDNKIRINSFRTHKNVPYSDHFPITAEYNVID